MPHLSSQGVCVGVCAHVCVFPVDVMVEGVKVIDGTICGHSHSLVFDRLS